MSDEKEGEVSVSWVQRGWQPREPFSVPAYWWEKKISNPWYSLATGKITLPLYIGKPNNYVCTVEETKEYVKIITSEAARLQTELNKMQTLVRAFETGRVSSYEKFSNPVPLTLAQVLESRLSLAEHTNRILTFLLQVVKNAKEVVRLEGDT